MLIEVGRHKDPISEVLYVDQLRHRREVLRVADISFGERHPAVRPLAHGLFLGLPLRAGVGDVKLYHTRHIARVLVLLARPLLKPLYEHIYLLVGSTDGDDSIA